MSSFEDVLVREELKMYLENDDERVEICGEQRQTLSN